MAVETTSTKVLGLFRGSVVGVLNWRTRRHVMTDSAVGVKSTVGRRELRMVRVHHHRIVHRLVYRTTRTSEHTVVLLGMLLRVHVRVRRRGKSMTMLVVVSIGRHNVRILLVLLLLLSLLIWVTTVWMTRVGLGRVWTNVLMTIVTNVGEGRTSGHGDWCTTMVLLLLLLGITVGSRSRTVELLQ